MWYSRQGTLALFGDAESQRERLFAGSSLLRWRVQGSKKLLVASLVRTAKCPCAALLHGVGEKPLLARSC